MKRTTPRSRKLPSKAAILKKRVRKIQGRAKFAGFMYLIGTIALTALIAVMPMLTGTCISTGMPVLAFYQPVLDLFTQADAFANLTVDQIITLLVVVLYAWLLLRAAINVLLSFGKLGWLFKRRASYTNGFNRNMYAMDDLAKIFSKTFAALIVTYLYIYVLSSGAAELTMNAYIALAAGAVFHFLCGLVGGTVTLFTTEDQIQEEKREDGIFVFFIRNLIQIAVVAATLYFFVPQSTIVTTIKELLQTYVVDKAQGMPDIMSLIPAVIELLTWLFLVGMLKHAVSAKEYNRDGLVGPGMRTYGVCAFFTALLMIASIVVPMLGILGTASTELNTNVIIAAAITLAGFVLNCIIKPRDNEGDEEISNGDEVDMDAYFQNGDYRYNNTII